MKKNTKKKLTEMIPALMSVLMVIISLITRTNTEKPVLYLIFIITGILILFIFYFFFRKKPLTKIFYSVMLLYNAAYLFFIRSVTSVFVIFLFLFILTGVTILLTRRKRFKICDKKSLKSYSGTGDFETSGKNILLEKSLYNEIIAVYNIFSHQLENFDPEDLENFKSTKAFALVNDAKYKMMTPGMEGNKILFTLEEFNLLKEGLNVFDLLFNKVDVEDMESFIFSPDFRLVKKVFDQLEMR